MAFYFARLELIACLQAQRRRAAIRAINDIILLVGKYSFWGNFSSQNTFSKIVALVVKGGQIRLEVYKVHYFDEYTTARLKSPFSLKTRGQKNESPRQAFS